MFITANIPNRFNPAGRRGLAIRIASFLLATCFIVSQVLGAAVRTGGTGRYYAFGVIEDFGSIVVGGIHYDETAADIVIDGLRAQPRSALKLGMVVDIRGSRDATAGTGVAEQVLVDRTLIGQVQRVDIAKAEVQILSQTVSLDAGTRFDSAGGLPSLRVGDWVGVHGLTDPDRRVIVATLIESLPAGESRIRGNVSNVKSGSFRIGQLTVTHLPTLNLEAGNFVTAVGRLSADGSLVASTVLKSEEVKVEEQADIHLEGIVADYRGPQGFTLNGIPVDVSLAEFENGRLSDLRDGVRVTVEGHYVNGVLLAEEIELAAGAKKVELEGRITRFDGLANFVVKDQVVDASSVEIRGRLPQPGWKAHVKGWVIDGKLIARSASFERP